MVVMHEQKKDVSIFSSIAIDKKNKINKLNMIGWTEPVAPNPPRAIAFLKSLTHDTFVYP